MISPAVGGAEETIQRKTAGKNEGYSRMIFVIKTPGVHQIITKKLSADGTVISETQIYRDFSYSLEYNPFNDPEAAEALAAKLAEDGKGFVLNDPQEVFENAAKVRHIHIDPRIIFMIIAIVLFLLDIAVRKFKWKWMHEIVRESREKKANTANNR